MTAAQWIAILAIGLPALVTVLWPLARGRGQLANASPRFDDRLELEEEKASIYQALAELDFDHETGSLSDDDYHSLHDRYEGRAALSIPASISGGIVFIGAPDLPWSSGPGSGLVSTGRRLSGGIMVSAGVV